MGLLKRSDRHPYDRLAESPSVAELLPPEQRHHNLESYANWERHRNPPNSLVKRATRVFSSPFERSKPQPHLQQQQGRRSSTPHQNQHIRQTRDIIEIHSERNQASIAATSVPNFDSHSSHTGGSFQNSNEAIGSTSELSCGVALSSGMGMGIETPVRSGSPRTPSVIPNEELSRYISNEIQPISSYKSQNSLDETSLGQDRARGHDTDRQNDLSSPFVNALPYSEPNIKNNKTRRHRSSSVAATGRRIANLFRSNSTRTEKRLRSDSHMDLEKNSAADKPEFHQIGKQSRCYSTPDAAPPVPPLPWAIPNPVPAEPQVSSTTCDQRPSIWRSLSRSRKKSAPTRVSANIGTHFDISRRQDKSTVTAPSPLSLSPSSSPGSQSPNSMARPAPQVPLPCKRSDLSPHIARLNEICPSCRLAVWQCANASNSSGTDFALYQDTTSGGKRLHVKIDEVDEERLVKFWKSQCLEKLEPDTVAHHSNTTSTTSLISPESSSSSPSSAAQPQHQTQQDDPHVSKLITLTLVHRSTPPGAPASSGVKVRVGLMQRPNVDRPAPRVMLCEGKRFEIAQACGMLPSRIDVVSEWDSFRRNKNRKNGLTRTNSVKRGRKRSIGASPGQKHVQHMSVFDRNGSDMVYLIGGATGNFIVGARILRC